MKLESFDIANPIGAIWAGAMMLDHLGEVEAAARAMTAIEKVLENGAAATPDLGGASTTDDLAAAVEGCLIDPSAAW